MIADIRLGSTFRTALDYGAGMNKKEKLADLVETHNLMSLDSGGIADEMISVSSLSHRIKKPVLHISLSFHPDEDPSRELMLKATHAYLRELDISPELHQIAIYEHHDTPHKHFHVYINRANLETGKAIDNKLMYFRSEVASRKVESALGLRRTDTIKKSTRKKPELEELAISTAEVAGDIQSPDWVIKDKDEHRFKVRHFVHSAVEKALVGGVGDREELARILKLLNIETVWKDDSQGNFVGASFKYDNLSITGNAAGFTASDLRKHFSGEKNCVEMIGEMTPKDGVTIRLSPEQLQDISQATASSWKEVRRKRGFHFESQAVEQFPFTDLLRTVARKSNLNEAEVYAYTAQFELDKKSQLPDIKKKEAAAFGRTSKSFLKLAESVRGNQDSRELFLAAMNLERRGNLLYLKDPSHLRYSASETEIAGITNSPHGDPVSIPKVFSFAERTVLLSAASGKEIRHSFYDLEPGRLKSIFEPMLYGKIEQQLNANYVHKVISDSPVRLEEKLDYLRQRGVVIEPTAGGGYQLGFIGTASTGEMASRVPASEAFSRLLTASGYGRQEYEASREALLSPRGKIMVTLAQAIDRGDTRQSDYIMSQVHRLNKDLAGYSDPRELLEALSGRFGSIRGQSSRLEKEARKIQWKNRRR